MRKACKLLNVGVDRLENEVVKEPFFDHVISAATEKIAFRYLTGLIQRCTDQSGGKMMTEEVCSRFADGCRVENPDRFTWITCDPRDRACPDTRLQSNPKISFTSHTDHTPVAQIFGRKYIFIFAPGGIQSSYNIRDTIV